jgi:Replication-relaxation
MTTSKRRSRLRRTSSGKRVELTERDIELFKLPINRYQFLRSNFLYAFIGGNSETRFKERLGRLYHDGAYINRPKQQWQFANSRHMPVVYELDARGEQVLSTLGLLHQDAPLLLKKGRMGACRQFAHQLMICECLASIELGVRRQPGLRFISWQEMIAKAPEQTRAMENPFAIPVSISHGSAKGATHRAEVKVVPDALFGLEYDRGGQRLYRFFALEADRNTMPIKRANLRQTSYLRKILAYREIVAKDLHRTHLGLPNFLVLTVTPFVQHMRNIMALVGELATGGKSTLFLFRTMSSLGDFQQAPSPAPDILTGPWQRVGYEPLSISSP